ncbi:MAG: hypothetical protein RJB43_1589 [Verrucomicrobiota bacterium]
MIRHAPAPTAVVRVTGEDAASFLQGQCTADLRKVALTDALWLNRKGRVLAHTVVAKEADGSFLLLCPHLTAEETIAIVTDNVIADDVVAADETSAWGRWVVWGFEPSIAGAKFFPTRRFGVEAWDVLTPAGAAMPGEAGRREELETLRIRAGVPAVPADCGANEFPQECGLEAIQSMGSLRRILRRVSGSVVVGQELKTSEGKTAVVVRSAAGDAGLALVSADLPEGAELGGVCLGPPAVMPAR